MTDYDAHYRAWILRQGPRALDLDWRLAHLPWRHRVLLRRFPVQGLRVLDYGCGDGVFAAALAERGAEVTGFDVSMAAIETARALTANRRGVRFTMDEPPADAFDMVFCTQVLEHIDDDHRFAARVLARARRGGTLIGTTPVGGAFFDPDHRHVYDSASLAGLLAPLGQVEIRRHYRTSLRNVIPWAQRGAAVFIFRVVRPA